MTPAPTTARPGSPEKQEVLAARYASGQRLWHPGDAAGDEESEFLGNRFQPIMEDE